MIKINKVVIVVLVISLFLMTSCKSSGISSNYSELGLPSSESLYYNRLSSSMFVPANSNVVYMITQLKDNGKTVLLKYSIDNKTVDTVCDFDKSYDYINITESKTYIIFADKHSAKIKIFSVGQGKFVQEIENVFSIAKFNSEINTISIIGNQVLITSKSNLFNLKKATGLNCYGGYLLIYDITTSQYVKTEPVISPLPNNYNSNDITLLDLLCYNETIAIFNPTIIPIKINENEQVHSSLYARRNNGTATATDLPKTSDARYSIPDVLKSTKSLFLVQNSEQLKDNQIMKSNNIISTTNTDDIFTILNPSSIITLSFASAENNTTFAVNDHFALYNRLNQNTFSLIVLNSKCEKVLDVKETSLSGEVIARPLIVGNHILYSIDNTVKDINLDTLKTSILCQISSGYNIIDFTYEDEYIYTISTKKDSSKYYFSKIKASIEDKQGPIMNIVIKLQENNGSQMVFAIIGPVYDDISRVDKVYINGQEFNLDEDKNLKDAIVQIDTASNNSQSIKIEAVDKNSNKTVLDYPIETTIGEGENEFNPAEKGTKIIPIQAKDINGNEINFEDFRNYKLFIVAGNPNCGSCVESVNAIGADIKKYDLTNVKFIVLSFSPNPKDAQRLISQLPEGTIGILDADEKLSTELKINRSPSIALLDKNLTLFYRGSAEPTIQTLGVIKDFLGGN